MSKEAMGVCSACVSGTRQGKIVNGLPDRKTDLGPPKPGG